MFRLIRQLFNKPQQVGRSKVRDANAVFTENLLSITPGSAGSIKQLVNAIIRESTAAALTAKASGGQSVATAVTSLNNEYTTVATAGDSATLPPSAACIGMTFFFLNATATSMNIFPDTGGKINLLAANAAFALAAGKNAMITCMKTGQWYAILSA